jgi:hypothetical protein
MIARPEKTDVSPSYAPCPSSELTSAPHADVDSEGINQGSDQYDDIGNDDGPTSTEFRGQIVSNESSEDGRQHEGRRVDTQKSTGGVFKVPAYRLVAAFVQYNKTLQLTSAMRASLGILLGALADLYGIAVSQEPTSIVQCGSSY